MHCLELVLSIPSTPIIFTVVGNVDELVSLILSLPVLLLSIARGTSLYSLQNQSTFPRQFFVLNNSLYSRVNTPCSGQVVLPRLASSPAPSASRVSRNFSLIPNYLVVRRNVPLRLRECRFCQGFVREDTSTRTIGCFCQTVSFSLAK